jgi:hypothetical protein
MTSLRKLLLSRRVFYIGNILILSLIGMSDLLWRLDIHPMIRVAVGFIWFVLPGGCLGYLLVDQKYKNGFVAFALSVPISIALIGVLGIIARTLQLNIDAINFVWYLLTITLTTLVIYQSHPTKLTIVLPRSIDLYMVVAVGMVLVFTFVAPRTMKKANDTLLHNADVTYFVSGEPLSWNEIYFDTDNRISDRAATTYWRLGVGIIVNTSHVHVLDAQSHIAALLMIYLGVSVFAGARLFGYPLRESLLIVILHFTIIALMTSGNQPGRLVLRHIFQDKILAGFGLAPIIFGMVYVLNQVPNRRHYILFGLLIVGSILTHSILAAFTIGVIVVWMVFNIAMTRRLSPYFQVMMLSALLFSPLFIIRQETDLDFNFGDDAIEVNDRIWLDETSGIYAANPHAIGELSIVILLAGVLGIFSFKRDAISRFHLAWLIIIAIGLIPYTAWIYGKAVGVYKIYRMGWIIPFGLAGFYLLNAVVVKLKPYLSVKVQKIVLIVSMVGAFCVVLFQAYTHIDWEPTMKEDVLIHELIEVGRFLESEHTERVVVMGDSNNRFEDYLVSTSFIIQPVSFCDERCMINFTGIDEESAGHRISRNRNFFSQRHDNAKRILNLNRYDVDYILYPNETGSQYVDPLLSEYPDNFRIAFVTENITLVEYVPAAN